MKPWMRWWWMGNAMDKQRITGELEEFAEAGVGGVEIIPIYGVKGNEIQFIRHLTQEWMDMLIHTLDEADRLGLGVDMILGTGWPFGGPQVEPEFAASKILIQTYKINAGEKFSRRFSIEDPEQDKLARLQYVFAFDDEGKKKDLISYLVDDRLEWMPERNFVIYAVFLSKTGQQVSRSAPGGEGYTIDHFSKDALMDFLEPYDRSLGPVKNRLRAVFNDSYEVYWADYTSRFFEEFQQRRGYDLSEYLPDLVSNSSGENVLRIQSDYRETLADLLLEEFSENWSRWARENTFKTRYQAHGSPGNLLDIYATADIPECETFFATPFDIPGWRWEESDARSAYHDPILLKFASSAAHISGKELTSSETFTWLREHFKTALSQCKPEVEQVFLSGVNHVFLHGSTSSPDYVKWPGWKFYASVNFVPSSAIWKDTPSMLNYITRCQSMLQSGTSDNELLVYWPFHDAIWDYFEGQLYFLMEYNKREKWLTSTPFYKLVNSLMDHGFSVDFVSDRFLEKAGVENGKIKLPGKDYSALIIPDCNYMPHSTMNSLIRFSESGGKVVFGGLPESVPGFYKYREYTDTLMEMISEAENGLLISQDVPESLVNMGIRGEPLKDIGLDFIRRDLEDGKIYFLVNHTPNIVDEYVMLGYRARSIILMDPLTGDYGRARIRSGKKDTEVYLQLKPGQSILLRTFETVIKTAEWKYYEAAGGPYELTGTWDIQFLSGGPAIPENVRIQTLKSWTGFSDRAESFSGTARYTIRFENPDPEISDWLIDLGDVRESARIWINKEYLGCLWSVPFTASTGMLQEGDNIMEIEVTNLSANRFRELWLKDIEWKTFYETNKVNHYLVNRFYREFDATGWEPMPSGLLGKVKLYPLGKKQF